MVQNLAAILRLMLVTDDRLLGARDPIAVCQAAERGGVTSVQLRLKEASPRELLALLRRLTGAVRVPVLVNDRLDVALTGGASGVHLGPDDMPVALARKITPPGFIVGASVGTEAEVANGESADYWGVGPYRVTATKSGAGEALGHDGLARILRLAPRNRACIAIGGVRPEDASAILETGARGIAVVSGILEGDDIEVRARAYAVRISRVGSG